MINVCHSPDETWFAREALPICPSDHFAEPPCLDRCLTKPTPCESHGFGSCSRLLDWLARLGEIDWSQALVDGSSVRAVFWGRQTGPNPTDRAKLGSKRHLICDGRRIPLAIQLTGANRNDSQQALALLDAIPSLQGERGRHLIVRTCVLGDRGYDAESTRAWVNVLGLTFTYYWTTP